MISRNQLKPQISLAFCAFFRVTDTRSSLAFTCLYLHLSRCSILCQEAKGKGDLYTVPQGEGVEAVKQGTTLTAEAKHPCIKAECVAISRCTILISYPATEGKVSSRGQVTELCTCKCLCLSTASQPSRRHIQGLT